MKYLINEEIDSYIGEIFAWTFVHSNVSLWLQAIPLFLWVVLGLLFILFKSYDWRNDTWLIAIGRMSIYVFVPIIYLFITGYLGYIYYK